MLIVHALLTFASKTKWNHQKAQLTYCHHTLLLAAPIIHTQTKVVKEKLMHFADDHLPFSQKTKYIQRNEQLIE